MSMIRDGAGEVITPNNPLPTRPETQGYVTPVDIQARLSETIQTHSGVTVVNGTSNASAWIDCDGFDKLGLSILNSGATPFKAHLQWSNDGASLHGFEGDVLTQTSITSKAIVADIKARYVKVEVLNTHTAPTTMSAWVYLKA